MKYPSTIILFVGGTHGNFLKTFWQLHNNIKTKYINDKGESFARMDYCSTMEEKKEILDNPDDFEILHTWHEYMTKWPSKFYYIEFNKEVMPEVMEIRYYKHNLIEEPFKLIRDLELTVGSKLTEQIVEKTDNFDSVIQDLFYRGKEKFKKQPGIEKINITELYEFDSFINLLKKLNIYNPKNLKIIKSRWQEFYNKNKYFIKKIQNKYSHNEN